MPYHQRAPVNTDSEIQTKGHPFVGVVWPAFGSKGHIHEVQMKNNGFCCTCPQFSFRGLRCKHITNVVNLIAKDYNDN